MLTQLERRALGAAHRRQMPRSAHGAWKPPPDRPTPASILAAQNATRLPELVPLRAERMRASAFAFLRGAAAIMAADLGGLPRTGLKTQLCGDAHIANFGAFASPEGRPVFDVNDFDETLPGPFEWDLKRLATSLVVCGRETGLSDPDCRELAARAIRFYRRHMDELANQPPLDAWNSHIDLAGAIESVGQAKTRHHLKTKLAAALQAHEDHYDLVRRAPADAAPSQLQLRLHGQAQHFPAHRPTVEAGLRACLTNLPPELADLMARYQLADGAFKVVGVGSVGTFCAIGLFASADGAPLLLQLKEAQASVLEPFAGPSPFATHAERVVAGQHRLQAQSDFFLRAAPELVAGHSFYLRRLKDSRLADIGEELETTLPFTASLCGRTLARAHARGTDPALLAGYMGESEKFDHAIAAFAMDYADQTKRDWQDFRAVKAP